MPVSNRSRGGILGRKLDAFSPLQSDDREAVEALTAEAVQVGPGCDLLREGDVCDAVLIVLQGFACRYKLLPGGQRQITAHLIPGDMFGLQDALGRAATCAVGTLAPSTVVQLPRDALVDLSLTRPAIGHALRVAAAIDEAVLEEWLVNVGRRTAHQRIAHLLCELLLRFRAIGAAVDDGYDLPLTQYDIGDTTALSVVHVNRTLQQLRGEGLIRWERRRVEVLDYGRLAEVAMFDPAYLRLEGVRRRREGGRPPLGP